jgi:hypothetical protein
MAAIPDSQHTTAYQIVRWYESKPQEHRPHMGASLIGHQCSRNIWLTWRWAMKPEFSGRILRLFSTGQREEPRLIEELRGIGATVWDTDPESGGQWRVSACRGHFGGSLDGVAKGLPEAPKTVAVLEFKTHSNKSFADLVAKKVQASKPQHYAQMQVYMGLMDLDRAMYLAVNKDTDEVYSEWVHFHRDTFEQLLERAQSLIDMTEPPARISEDPAFYVCKMCNFWKLCHGEQAAEMNCRTCCHATPGDVGTWRCESHGKQISIEEQRAGCNAHLLLPALVPYAEVVDGGEGWMAYRHKDNGVMFVNGPEGNNDYGPVFSSKELHNCPGSLMSDIAAVKNEFGGKVASGEVYVPFNVDDIATHPDDLVAAPAPPDEKKKRRQNKAFLNALEQMK